MRPRSWFSSALCTALALALVVVAPPAPARDWRAPAVEVGVEQLPAEARETLALIKRGGPFPYPKDGAVFQNRERRLPEQPRGYYREYTVRTPTQHDRGPRRIVAGRGRTGDSATGGEYYYTDDHYETFRRIRE